MSTFEELLGGLGGGENPYENVPGEELAEGKDVAVLLSFEALRHLKEIFSYEGLNVTLPSVPYWYEVFDAVAGAIPIERVAISDNNVEAEAEGE